MAWRTIQLHFIQPIEYLSEMELILFTLGLNNPSNMFLGLKKLSKRDITYTLVILQDLIPSWLFLIFNPDHFALQLILKLLIVLWTSNLINHT